MNSTRKNGHQQLLKQKKIFETFYYEKKEEARRLGRKSTTSNNTKKFKKLKVLTLKSTLLTQSNSNLRQVLQLNKKNQYALFNIADITAQAFLIVPTKEAPRLKRVITIIEWEPIVLKHQNEFIVGIYVQKLEDYKELVSQQKFKKDVLKSHQNYQIMNISRAAELSAKLNDFQSPQQFERKRNLLFKTKPKQYNFKKDKRKMSKISSEEEKSDFSDNQRSSFKGKNNERQRSKSANMKNKFKSNQQIKIKEKSIRSQYRNKQNYRPIGNIELIADKIQNQNKKNLQGMPSKYRKIRLNFLIRRELYKDQYESRFRGKLQYQRMYQHPNYQDFFQNQQDSYSQTSYRSSNRSFQQQQDFDERQYR